MVNTLNIRKGVEARPFVKWAGGKNNLLQTLDGMLPPNLDNLNNVTYIEPFVGGGAMLFYLLQNHKCIKKAIINDINPDLIRCYQLILESPRLLIDRLREIEKQFFTVSDTEKEHKYYAYREKYNTKGLHPDERAALLLFLNHTCYNGLFRVNEAGNFNVPYGRYKRPIICNEELILKDHQLLNSIDIIIRPAGDYKSIIKNLSKKNQNLIYFDPPYRPLSNTSYFKKYSNSPFGDDQQEELKKFCDRLSQLNCFVILSNSDSKNKDGESYFEHLYTGYRVDRVDVPRYISALPDKRRKLTEIIIRNY